jgi:hypothetical protein
MMIKVLTAMAIAATVMMEAIVTTIVVVVH